MQWSAIIGFVVFVISVGSVKGILIFSFCAVVSFIFARNLLNEDTNLDFTRYFTSKVLGLAGERKSSGVARRSFPSSLRSCRHALIRNILRDFVISWYENVGLDGAFILETRSFLEEATVNFYDKLASTSVSCHTQKLCVLLHRHLETTQNAKLSKNHKNFVDTYRSLKKEDCAHKADQLQYLRNVVDLLLYKVVAPKTLGCDTGRYILREILALKLMMPLVDTISDPDFVNTSIINIFGKNNDENVLTTSEGSEPGKSNLKVSASFMEYLNEDLKDNNRDKKSDGMGSGTKYKFKNATVVERESTEIVELCMEVNPLENNDTSNDVENNGSIPCPKTDAETTSKTKTDAETTSKTNECRPAKTSKQEQTHSSSILNGLTKVKNDILKSNKDKSQSSKFNVMLGGKGNSGGTIFAKQLRKIQSFPTMKQSTVSKLKECASKEESISEKVSDIKCDVESSEKGVEVLGRHHVRSVSLGNDCGGNERDGNACDGLEPGGIQVPGKPKLISGRVERESVPSSFEEVGIDDNIAEEVPDPGSYNSSKVSQTFTEQQFPRSCNRKTEPSLINKNPRLYATSFSSTGEWDSEVLESTDDRLIFDVGEDFLESDGVVHKPGPTEDDTVSKADFAPHDVLNPCSLINIPSTELVTDHSFEPYKSKYTVYVIEYSKQLWANLEADNDLEKQETSEADTQCVIKRRYREFMELHHRLVCGPCATLMKDIPKPNRKYNSPFFRLDQDVVEGRQLLLENYLKCLVTKSLILNCEDFKGFLGIGDQSQTDFRRVIIVVPTLPQVPRIDKKLQKKVTKIIGHIKTAFDTGPIEGDKEEEYDDIRQVLGEDKTSQDDIRTFVVCSGGCKLNHSCCYSDNCFNAFLQQHHHVTQLDGKHSSTRPSKEGLLATKCDSGSNSCENAPSSRGLKNGKHLPSCNHVNSSKLPGKQNASLGNGSFVSSDLQGPTNPLTKTILNLSCHLLESHESWVCLEPIQQAATSVFGWFFEWWIDSLLSGLVTEEQWQFYLSLLTDTMWPRGQLMVSSEQEKSEEERLKTKEEAIAALSNFFGVVLHTALGSEALEYSAREIVESFQHEEINRQVLLDILEVILAEVFPELIDEKDSYVSSRKC